jgi:hypothetical protein
MDAQAISNATAKNGLAGLAISGDLSRQGTGALVAISSLERKGRQDEPRPPASPVGGSGNHDQVAQSFRETST